MGRMADDGRRDREDIIELLRGYAEAIDGRDRERVREIFTPDALLDYSSTDGPRGRRDEVVDWLLDALGGITLTQHLLTNHDVEVDGDLATAGTLMLNPLVLAGDGPDDATVLLFGGRYDDRLLRTEAGWRITHRVHTVSWQAGPMPGRLVGTDPSGPYPRTRET
jgi:ketosteroid isomerase-like protein